MTDISHILYLMFYMHIVFGLVVRYVILLVGLTFLVFSEELSVKKQDC